MPVENLLHLRVLCKTIFNKQNAQGKPALIRIRLSDSSLIFLESNNISHDTATISRQYGMLLTAQFNEPEDHERERMEAAAKAAQEGRSKVNHAHNQQMQNLNRAAQQQQQQQPQPQSAPAGHGASFAPRSMGEPQTAPMMAGRSTKGLFPDS